MKTKTYASVWDAIEDTKEAAANMRLRATLMMDIESYLAKHHLTQADGAKRFGVTQPRLNDLLRGRIGKFSVDALVNMLACAGREVAVHIKKAA